RAIAAGQIHCVMEAKPKSLSRIPGSAAPAPYIIKVDSSTGEQSIPCHRIIARLGAVPTRSLLEGAGAKFLSDAPDAAPELSSRYESTVPGLYVIGALAGFPLIKQAMNQGYEVVEHLLGREVKPADHDILRAKFRTLRGGGDVERIVSLIHKGLPLFRDIQMLALRELLLVSTVITPSRGTSIFAK